MLTCAGELPALWLAFCDNAAGKPARAKGYGRDHTINHLLSFYWAVVAAKGWFPHLECVASDLTSQTLSPDSLWVILERVATDLEYALHGAVQDALALRWQFQSPPCESGLCRCGCHRTQARLPASWRSELEISPTGPHGASVEIGKAGCIPFSVNSFALSHNHRCGWGGN